MLIKAILLGLVSLVAVVDSRLIGRQNIGRPLILSTLAGLVLGDMKQGIILGASLELMSMGFVAIGAAGPPNMQLVSVIATAFAILSCATTEEALSLAIPVAVAGEFLSELMRLSDQVEVFFRFGRSYGSTIVYSFPISIPRALASSRLAADAL